ncbi:class F sortase [Propionibacterium sp.]|uniref:class F sortase n=1 Tax=Propionibacterium sp. TaxID=1977903 RepID=UPI0039EA6633
MRKFVRVVAILVLLGALAFAGWRAYQLLPSDYEKALPVYTPGAPSSAQLETGNRDSSEPVPASCEAHPTSMVGETMTIEGHGKPMPMLTLGLAADDTPAVPPGNDGYTIGWYDQGPMIGSDKGNVILTAHTFRYGGALGNELNNGLLRGGEIFRFTDAQGSTVCYRFSHAGKVMVDNYDPQSNVIYDSGGAPQVVLVVCADYPLGRGEPLARALYYADLVRAA